MILLRVAGLFLWKIPCGPTNGLKGNKWELGNLLMLEKRANGTVYFKFKFIKSWSETAWTNFIGPREVVLRVATMAVK